MSGQQAYRKTLGDAIRRQREALGQVQADVARGTGASEASISNWENGKYTLSAYWHAQLANYFKDEFAKLEAAGKAKRSAKIRGSRNEVARNEAGGRAEARA